MRKILILSIYLVSFLLSKEVAAIVMVWNKQMTKEISKEEVRKIYLGYTSRWADNTPIMVADYVLSNPLRKNFSSKVLNMKPFRVYKRWIKVSLKGGSSPPQYLRSKEEMIDFLKNNKGAIGYLDEKVKLPATLISAPLK